MKKGPARAELGMASCPLCHHPMKVATNKHGYPAAYCRHCGTQFQPRDELGSLLLLGKVHEWTNHDAAAVMLAEDDRAGMVATAAAIPPRLPPHLAAPVKAPAKKSPPAPPAPPAKPKGFLAGLIE